MYTEVSQAGQALRPTERKIGLQIETAETIQANAFQMAHAKMNSRERGLSQAELLQRQDFLDYYKHALAQEVAKVIAAHDHTVISVYLFDEATNPDGETEDYLATKDLTIHLLVLVRSKSAALEAFSTSLDRALTEVLRQLPSAHFAGRTSFLDVIPVTECDVEDGRGYAVLLSSFYARPLKIWQRD